MISQHTYFLINMKDDIEEMIETLVQLQEDIPEVDPEFVKIEKIIKHLKMAVTNLE